MTGAGDRRRAVLLSGSLGRGHDTLAEACAASLAEHGFESTTLDSMALLGSGGGAIGDWVFRRILGVPPVYDAFHFNQLRAGGVLARFADRTAVNVMYSRFEAAVASYPPELIVSVFATGAAAAARYKRECPGVVTTVFVTDTVAHRMWVHDETDLFLVTSEAAAASVRRYRPRADVVVVTAPVRQAFYAPPSRDDARGGLGVALDARCVLLMSGGWGIGPLDRAARLLAGAGLWVLAVAGDNRRLRERLGAVAAEEPRVVAFGYTDRIPELMAACDVVVTSSGDTCREARAVGRGLVLLDTVPGHGRENLMHELELGHAAVASPEPEQLLEVVEAFLDEKDGATPLPVGSWAEWDAELTSALARVGIDLEP